MLVVTGQRIGGTGDFSKPYDFILLPMSLSIWEQTCSGVTHCVALGWGEARKEQAVALRLNFLKLFGVFYMTLHLDLSREI